MASILISGVLIREVFSWVFTNYILCIKGSTYTPGKRDCSVVGSRHSLQIAGPIRGRALSCLYHHKLAGHMHPTPVCGHNTDPVLGKGHQEIAADISNCDGIDATCLEGCPLVVKVGLDLDDVVADEGSETKEGPLHMEGFHRGDVDECDDRGYWSFCGGNNEGGGRKS